MKNNRITLLASWLALAPFALADPAATITLDSTAAAPAKLGFDGREVPLSGSPGGFVIRDFKGGRDIVLRGGAVARDGDSLTFTAQGDDLSLRATFVPGDGCIRVSGEIASQKPEDRAIIVRYVLPLPAKDAVFGNGLSRSVRIASGTEALGTVFPIAAMTGPDWGAALEIPPTFPCCFGMTGSAQGLGVELYLGLSPLVRAFPNRAAFSFVIAPAQPDWGFRSALAQYYARYPGFYRPRIQGAGLWNWNDPVGLADERGPAAGHGLIDEALALYTFHGLTHGGTYAEQCARDRRLGVLSFAYTIVGMREFTRLQDLPAGPDAAMAILGDVAKKWKAEGPAGPLHRKYLANNERNRDLPEQIATSTVVNADGRPRLNLRSTPWGANSVTFVENPNPRLFEDKGWATVGSVTLKMLADWLARDPAPGVHLDSLGSHWPACVNYQRKHFPYAQYPLTFDKAGRVALHNMVSHYEFIEAADALARKNGKFVFGNGIDIYESRKMEEHYNGRENGRFFLAAQLDAAGREIEDDVLTRERLDAFRTCMGTKPMTAVLYLWHDADLVKTDMNRALAYDIFAAPNRFFADKTPETGAKGAPAGGDAGHAGGLGISYIGARDGFARDRDLILWFVRNARMLNAAGWQPVTHARVNCPDVACERYGGGDVIYFSLVNLGRSPVACELSVDMGALDISPKGGESSFFSEVARDAVIRTATEGDTGRVRITLQPDEANIIKLARTW